ncbi:MAG: SpoIVB peptidase S55 domain-containing protein [Vicinamibacterales bacterium]
MMHSRTAVARAAALGSLLFLALSAAVPAQTRLMPIDEITPGMVGTGRTVFEGAALEDFKVHILGVLRNVLAPNRNLILARLEGGPLAKTGVIAGMSGSPVYVDGRLIGAVSYALGQFATEPIAGITPIAEMTDATTMPAPGPATRPVALSWPPVPEELFAVWARDLGRSQPAAPCPAPCCPASRPAPWRSCGPLRCRSWPAVSSPASSSRWPAR